MTRKLLLLATAFLAHLTLTAQTNRYWVTGGDGNWNSTSNWSATSGGGGGASVPNANTFRVIFDANSGSPTVSVNLVNFSLQQMWITDNQSVTFVSSGGARVITIGDGTNNSIPGATLSNADVVIEAGSTLVIQGESAANTMSVRPNANANSQVRVAGTVRVDANGILANNTGPYFFVAGANYVHNRNGGTITSATWDVASNVNITGISNAAPSGFGQTFWNLTWNSPAQTGPVSILANPTVNATFRLQNSNGQIVRLTGDANNRTLTVNNFIQDAGIFELSNQAGNWGLLNVTGTFTQNGGTITKSSDNASNEIRFSGATNVSPVLNGTINSTGLNQLIFNANKTAPARVILPTNQTFDATVQLRVTTGTLDLGSTTSTVTVNGPFSLQAAGTVDMSGNANHIFDLKGSVTYAAGGSLLAGTDNQQVRYTGGAQSVFPATYRNLLFDGTGTKTMLGAFTVGNNLTVQGTATLLTNEFQITGNATGQLTVGAGAGLTLGSTAVATNILFPTNFVAANISLDPASTVTYQANTAQSVSDVPAYGNLSFSTNTVKTLTGTNSTLSISGNLTITAGTFNLGTSATTVNISGNATVTGALTFGATAKTVSLSGTLSGTGTINMDGVALAHTLNLNGATNTISTFNTTLGSGSTVNYNRLGDQTVFISANYRNLTISGSGVKSLGAGNLTIADNLVVTDATLAFNAAGPRTVSVGGNLSGNGTIDMSAGSQTHTLNLAGATNTIGNLVTVPVGSAINYTRSGAQTVFGSPNYRNLGFAGGSIKTLEGNVTVGGTLTLTLGLIQLDNFNLDIAAGATIAGGSVTAMVITNGSGQLRRVFPAGASAAFTFPVGDLSGSNDYSPVSLTFNANSAPRTIGVRVTDEQHPNDGTATDYISRYWTFTDSEAGTYNYNATFTYSTVAPTDLVGVHANLRVNRWNGSLWTQYTTAGAAPTLTANSLTETTGTLNGSDFTGRVNIATYTWNRTDDTGDWQNASHWTPARLSPQPTDILLFNNNGTTTATNVPTQTIGRLVVLGNTNVSLVSQTGAARTLTIGSASGTNLDIQAGSTLQLSSTGVDQINIAFAPATQAANIDGTLVINPNTGLSNTYNASNSNTVVNGTIVNNGGTITSAAANLSFSASGNYNHSRDGGAIPTATWNVSSNANILGITVNAPTGIGQTFGNFIWNATGQTAAVNINAAPTAINGTFRIQNTNGQIVRLTGGAGAAVTWNVLNFLQNDGALELSSNGNNGILNVSGTFTQSGGSIIKTGASTGSEIRLTGTDDVSPILAGTITGLVATPLIFNANKTAPARVILPTNQTFDASVQLRVTTGVLDMGSAASTVTVNGGFNMSAATATFDMSGNADHRLNLRGANLYTAGSTFIAGAGNQIVSFEGDADQTVMPVTYRNLAAANFNPASLSARTKTIGGAVVVTGNLTISGISSAATVTLQLGGNNFNVAGQTAINAFGILNDNALAGTNLFEGAVSVNANGQWVTTNNPPFTFRGGLSFNGSNFVSGSGTYTFNTNNQTIEGSQSLTIDNIVTSGITLTNRHTAGLTTSTISGNGNFTNGDVGYSAILYVTAANPFTLTGTLDLATNPNTVDYTGTGAQTIGAYNFYNLSTSGGRLGNNITLANGGTIGIAGSLSPAATFTTGNYVVSNNTVNFNGTANQNIPALRATNPYNNLTISGNSTKTLVTPVTVNNALNLNGGILELDDYNLTILSSAVNAIQGTFDANNMISTNGVGRLIKNAQSSQALYPIGSGGYYSPLTITAIAPTSGTLNVRAVPVALNPSYINKYWDIFSSVARTSVTATFQYDPAELNGASQNVSYSPDNGSTWQNPPTNGTQTFGTNSFTITGTFPFAGWWTMGYKTFYSFQTGDWNNPTTWTTDPSGTLQIGTTIPGYNDKVVILTGRTVSLTSDIATQNLDITLNSGGTIDMGSFSYTNGLLALRGQGTLKLASANFPNAVTNTLVISGGGTVEYNAAINLPTTPSTYNNLNINAPGSVVLLNNLTLFGNLQVVNGTFQINDNTPTRLRLIVNGNINVFPSGAISVGNGVTNTTTNPLGINGGTAPFLNYYINHSHRVEVYGNFTNEGTVRFTNLPFPIYNAFPSTTLDATTGFATVFFLGATNNTLTCEGITDFYNLVVDKGTDQTFRLTINSSDYANFRLFGANIAPGENPGTDPFMKKALWLRAGTLSLDGFIVIPSLTEGTDGASNPNSDFYIPASAALIIDDANVVLMVTADSYDEVNAAYGVSGGSGLVNGVTRGIGNALHVLGSLEVNNGYLSTRESAGIVYTNSQIAIRGGVVDAKQFRPASGLGLVSYVQLGGDLLLRGRMQRTPAAYTGVDDLVSAPLNTARANEAALRTDVGTFSINNTLGVFNISNGTIKIFDTPDAVNRRSFEVLSSAANYSVTGGTVTFEPSAGSGSPDAASWLLTSTAPLGNATINRLSGTTFVQLQTGYPLTVLRNLTLEAGELVSNNLNVSIGGNFTVQGGATYTHGTNTTILNGTIPQAFTVNTAVPLSLNGLSIVKPAGSAVTLAGSQSTINVNGAFRLEVGTLNDNGKTINLLGNAFNSGLHTGTGRMVMAGDAAQTIDGDGQGIFRNLELNKPNDGTVNVTVAARLTINGTLSFTGSAAGYKRLNMQGNNLTLGTSATVAGASENRFVQFDGNFGDGGLSKVYSATAPSFTFPVATLNPTVRYTPATISMGTAPTTWGTITVTPVKTEHPNTTTKNISLRYFWKVRSTGFSGVAPASVTHSYTYSQDDVVAQEADYIPARYNQTSFIWTFGTTASIDAANNVIGAPWLSNTDHIDGDYTAGDANPTNPFGAPTIFYSRINGSAPGSGLWSNVNTWSTVSHTGPVAGTVPGANDIVIIGGRDSVTLATTNTVPNTDVRSCATLMIEVGSALDIGFNPASSFSVVRSHPNGNGNFRVTTSWTSGSTFAFPAGDFSDFNVNRGTTELYSTNPAAGTTYWLPNNISSYGNLILSPLGGSNIIFGNTDLMIYGNLVTRGQNADSWFCPTWVNLTPYPTPPTVPIAKTITINGHLDIQGGGLIWIGNGSLRQDIVVHGNVIVAPWGAIAAWTGWGGANNQSLSIGGSLINNTNNATQTGVSTPSRVNFNNGASVIPVTFFGPNNANVTSTPGVPGPLGPGTFFNTVRVNKGTSQATTLTVNIGGTLTTPTDNWLTLQSGTLIYQRTGNLNISTNTPFAIEAPAGLTINTPSNVFIGNASNNAGDLILNGRLTLINGTVNVGPTGSPANNNDIEYSGGGSSALDIRGGTLFVNGQIRRNATSLAGVLNYSQSGGNVIINGQAQLATRAKLEVLNPGSRFNMSGGTLTFVRGGGTTFGDLYLRPEAGSVTGGDIVFTQVPSIGPVVDAVQNYSLEANLSLNNVTVTGKTAATARNATLNLMVSPLTLNGSLTLTNAQSFFNANNRNLTLRGNFTNNNSIAAYTFGSNTTTFNGGSQQVGGSSATNFHNLTIASTATVTLNFNTNIAGGLNIATGNLALGSIRANVQGNLTNNGSFFDNNTLTSGVRLNGSVQQEIAGTGSFGRLEINNPQGARALNDLTFQNDLLMTQGNLTIGQHLLSLGVNSNLGGAPFSQTKMIITDGVASSRGFRKFFGVSAVPQTYTFPVGVPSKYTPVSLTLDQNASVGYIGVTPVNNHHPAIAIPTSVLKYYWKVESAGVSNLQGNMQMRYLDGDVNGDENVYIAAFLLSPGAYWSKAQPGPATDNVDEANNLISYGIPSGTNNITGDYTAVTDGDLPDEVPSYITISNGNWSDETIWAPQGSSPPCPPGGPNGFNVTIEHEVTTDVNYCFAYRTTINGRLRVVSPTFGHNIGAVEGTGTLYLENGNLPAGLFDQFLDCSNVGTLEYGGSGNYTILASQFNSVPNLLFTGSGTRTLPDKDLTICRRLVIDGPTLDNNTHKRRLTILGTMERYSTGAFNAGTGPTSTVTFAGNTLQTLGGPTGNFVGTNRFNNLEINNPNGLSIGTNGNIEIGSSLLLTEGVINTAANNRLTIFNTAPASVTPAGGTATSYVNGPLIKRMLNGGTFMFPLGKNVTKGHPFTFTNNSGTTINFTSEFFAPNPTYNSLTAPLEATNSGEYWTVAAASGSRNGKVKVGWDASSDLTPAMTQNGLVDMRVAEYNTATNRWEERASVATGSVALGEVEMVNNVAITTTPKSFTSGSVTTTKPRAAFNPSGPVCGGAGIPVRFTSFSPINLNYTLDYTINGVPQPTVTITALPYVLPTPVNGVYQLTGFTYNNGAGTDGVVSPTTVTVNPIPTTADAGPDQSLCGVSGVTLQGNNPAPFTGLWTIRSGTGGILLSPTSPNSVFNGQLGNTYVLRWTISSGGCTSWDEVTISFPVAAAMPSNFTVGPTSVCQGATVTYTVPAAPSTTYNWSYSGTGANINGLGNPVTGVGNSVTVTFSPTATSGVMSVTATNACGTSPARTRNVTIVPLPVAPDVITGTSVVCQGESGVAYSVPPIANATGYVWSLPTGAAIATGSNTNSITVNYSVSAVSGNVTVRGTNSCGSGPTSAPFPVTVNPRPTINLGANPRVCKGSSPALLTYSATTNAPNHYNIDFDAAAEAEGFVDVVDQPLPASPIGITVPLAATAGSYSAILTVRNSTTGCISQNYNISIIVLPLPTSVITALLTPATICEGEAVEMTVQLAGQAPFTFTIQDNYGGTWAVNTLNTNYTFVVPVAGRPVWFAPDLPNIYKYTILNMTDDNGCIDVAPAGEAEVSVYKIPQTGPQYHIPNANNL